MTDEGAKELQPQPSHQAASRKLTDPLQRVSTPIWGVIVISFFLPFLQFTSCQFEGESTVVGHATGMQLATGTAHGPGLLVKVGHDPVVRVFAVLALACALIGFGLSFVRGPGALLGSVITGVSGSPLVPAIAWAAASDLSKRHWAVRLNMSVALERGAFLALVGFVTVAALNVSLLYRLHRRARGEQLVRHHLSRTLALILVGLILGAIPIYVLVILILLFPGLGVFATALPGGLMLWLGIQAYRQHAGDSPEFSHGRK